MIESDTSYSPSPANQEQKDLTVGLWVITAGLEPGAATAIFPP